MWKLISCPMQIRILLIAMLPICASWAMDQRLIEPGEQVADGQSLRPFLARYKEILVVDGQRKSLGIRYNDLQEANYPSGKGFRWTVSMLRGDTVYDELRFLRRGFEPVMRVVSARSLIHQFEVYGTKKVAGVKVDGAGADPQPLSLTVHGKRFPAGVITFLLSQMPPREGFSAVFPIFSSDMGADGANIFEKVVVLGKERLLAGNGVEYDSWVLQRQFLDHDFQPLQFGGREMPPYKMWLSEEPPYQIRTERGNGTLELMDVYLFPSLE